MEKFFIYGLILMIIVCAGLAVLCEIGITIITFLGLVFKEPPRKVRGKDSPEMREVYEDGEVRKGAWVE